MKNKNTLTKSCCLFLLIFFGLLSERSIGQNSLTVTNPAVFSQLDSTCMTPDALAFDKEGNIYLSVTNATSYDTYGSKILKLDKYGKIIWSFESLPIHPKSQKVHPMGMALGPDGNLYIADNQIFAGQSFESRLLKATLKDGKIEKTETVVLGLNIANGLRIYNGSVFVTDPKSDNNRKSSVYVFNIAQLNGLPISLNEDNRKRYLLYEMELDEDAPDGVGIDGLDFDNNDNLYVGNFTNGSIAKLRLNKKNQLIEALQLIRDTTLVGCDGLIYDRLSNSLLITNFMSNSILQYQLNSSMIKTLWKNDDATCSSDLDCPCDLAIYNGKLIVVNFDTYTTPANTTIDNCNTISSFDLNRH